MSLKKCVAQTFGEASLTYDANAFVQRFCANYVCALAKKTWDDVSKKCFPQTILDVGSGTGFVP